MLSRDGRVEVSKKRGVLAAVNRSNTSSLALGNQKVLSRDCQLIEDGHGRVM